MYIFHNSILHIVSVHNLVKKKTYGLTQSLILGSIPPKSQLFHPITRLCYILRKNDFKFQNHLSMTCSRSPCEDPDLTSRAADPEGPWREQDSELRISFNANLRLNLITCDTVIKEEWCLSKIRMLDTLFLLILLCVILSIHIIIFSTHGQGGPFYEFVQDY